MPKISSNFVEHCLKIEKEDDKPLQEEQEQAWQSRTRGMEPIEPWLPMSSDPATVVEDIRLEDAWNDLELCGML